MSPTRISIAPACAVRPGLLPAALVAAGLALAGPAAAADGPPEAHWPQFRGPGAAGISEQEAPVTWSVPEGENVLWKTPVPGLGLGGAVIWGDRLFVTTAVSEGGKDDLKVGLYGDIKPVEDDSVHRWLVLCLDRKTGEVLWQRTAHEGVPAVKRHTKASHANSTPATDGERVVAFFGSEGLHAWDMKGKPLWKKDFGVLDAGFFMVPEAQWGFGSSPVLHDGKVLIQVDVQKDSFIAALDAATGEVLWKTPRKDVPTWGSPTVVKHDGGATVVANGWKEIAGYDLATGKQVWTLEGGGDIPVPTPVAAHDLVFITNAHGSMSPIYAIPAGITGTVRTGDDAPRGQRPKWWVERGGAYMQTPLVLGDVLYTCRDNGVLSAYVARTGTRLYQERLGGGSSGFTASPVAAGNRLYFTSEMGDVHVIEADITFKELAVNELDEVTMATPAVAEGTLYFRTRGHVVAIGEKAPEKPARAAAGAD